MPWAIGLAVSAIATAYSITQQRKSAKAQEEAADQQQALTDLENRKARARAVRDARIQRAAMIQGASDVGATGSSAVEGAKGAIGSQLGSAIGFSQMKQAFGQNIASAQSKAARYDQNAALGQSIGSIGKGIYRDTGGPEAVQKFFQ